MVISNSYFYSHDLKLLIFFTAKMVYFHKRSHKRIAVAKRKARSGMLPLLESLNYSIFSEIGATSALIPLIESGLKSKIFLFEIFSKTALLRVILCVKHVDVVIFCV